jgi:hypothetical protein
MESAKVPRHLSYWVLIAVLVAVVVFFPMFWTQAAHFLPPEAGVPPKASDEIAAASALFSALAFVGLVFTVLVQREDLLAQRRDHDELEKDIQEQRRLLRAQAEANTQQAFENTFFHLLRLHNDNVNSQTARFVRGGEVYTGRRAFSAAAGELEGRLAVWMQERPGESITLPEINRIYSAVCEIPDADFGHYFRNLYHIVKYVEESRAVDKKRYVSQVRAQFSQAEFALLYANGLRREGKSKFRPLIEDYSLLHEARSTPQLAMLARFYADRAAGIAKPLSNEDVE